jgi:hypothetical protein
MRLTRAAVYDRHITEENDDDPGTAQIYDTSKICITYDIVGK